MSPVSNAISFKCNFGMSCIDLAVTVICHTPIRIPTRKTRINFVFYMSHKQKSMARRKSKSRKVSRKSRKRRKNIDTIESFLAIADRYPIRPRSVYRSPPKTQNTPSRILRSIASPRVSSPIRTSPFPTPLRLKF